MLLATGAINVLSLATPITLMQVYDRIVPNQSFNTLGWLLLGCAVAIIIEGGLRYVRAYIGAWTGARFEHKVACKTVDSVLLSRLEQYERFGLGVHLDRMNAIQVLRSYYSGQVFQVLLDLPFAIIFLFAIWYLAPMLLWVPIGAAVAFFVLTVVAKLGFSKARSHQMTVNDRRFNFVIEMLRSIHLVRSQTMEEQMLRRHDRLQGTLAEANIATNFWKEFPNGLGATISQLSMFSVIGFGGTLVMDGALTLGGLAAVTLLSGRAFQPIQSAAGFWLRLSEAKISKARLEEAFSMGREVDFDTPPLPMDIEGAVRLQNVSFRYNDDTPMIVDGVSLTIRPGEMIGIAGATGTGTTTLLQLMIGALKPTQGRILIDDYDLACWDHTDLRGRVSYLEASGTLFKGTILQNIAMFQPEKNAAALDAADLLDLDAQVALLPHGYETMVDNQAASFLPSALIQRICIARALVNRPRVLLLDKTYASLDRGTEKVLDWVIERLKGQCTIVLVAAKTHALRPADRIYALDKGKLVERVLVGDGAKAVLRAAE